MIPRQELTAVALKALRNNPVTALLGPRQCGKTTLARQIAKTRKSTYFDLEDPADLAQLSAPQFALQGLTGLVVIDEVQRKPELLELLRVLADRPRVKARFLLLGSASPHLVRGLSESLAGRVGFVEMGGFSLPEVGVDHARKLWLRGTFPRAFLARTHEQSFTWRNDFIRTFLERDIPQLGISVPAQALRRFWTMVAHYHGQIWNAADFARSLGASEKTARKYLDLLTGAYVIRQLQPWYENIGKRQVKAPKVYVRDSGLLHCLLALRTSRQVMGHPKYGASWEGFAVEQILTRLRSPDSYFWATHAVVELDLLTLWNGRRYGMEIKCEDAPRTTKSMRIALQDLGLSRLFVVYPGATSYTLDENIEVLSIRELDRLPF